MGTKLQKFHEIAHFFAMFDFPPIRCKVSPKKLPGGGEEKLQSQLLCLIHNSNEAQNLSGQFASIKHKPMCTK